jgi:uncharacterized metal-binding protein YceD (DUF177 family)
MKPLQPIPEFSRPFAVDRLGFAPVTETLRATPEERQRLAARLGLVSIGELAATVTLTRDRNTGLVHVEGRLEADVVQTCVVSLTPFPSHVEDSLEDDFGDTPVALDSEIAFDMESDPPDPIVDGAIDLGELVTQYLSLALDPYPRAPGSSLEPAWTEPSREALSPFAVLKNLKAGG